MENRLAIARDRNREWGGSVDTNTKQHAEIYCDRHCLYLDCGGYTNLQ